MMKYFIAITMLFLAGCFTDVVIHTTKPFEGRYDNTNDFYIATSNIVIDVNEPVWVLSAPTLKQVLKNVK